MLRPYVTLDVFTEKRFAGNPLAVILDARGLSDEAMQSVAREFNYPETTFVFPPEDPAHAARVRIFTLSYEMPFAGHPTVGTAIALARARGTEGRLTLELKAGLFPVRVAEDASRWFAEFQNPNLPSESGAAPPPEAIERALSLPPGAVDRGAHRPRRIGAGVDFFYAGTTLAAARAARLDLAAAERIDFAGAIGIYLYAEGGELEGSDYHVRMFAPEAGVPEDPATGSAAAAFPGQLLRAGALADGGRDLRLEQGVEMGRPSRIDVRVETALGAVARVAVGGCAVPVMAGEIDA